MNSHTVASKDVFVLRACHSLKQVSVRTSFENANNVYDFRGSSQNLCECLANVISELCLTSATHKQVQQEFDRVINRIRIGEVSEELCWSNVTSLAPFNRKCLQT